jgi:2-aminobenzoate-CoA ligase
VRVGRRSAARATRQLWKQATGIEIIDGIGSTEMLHIFISPTRPTPARRHRPAGARLPCRVLDDDGQPLPPGQVGRLAVQGPTGCKYLADERQTSTCSNGWNLTGDAYLVDADGQFVYQARTDDMIISGGYNIAGPEVESALLLHPAVAECGVVGVPDEERGQIVKAFVVLRPRARGATRPWRRKALQDFVKQTVAPYKYPRAVEFRTAACRAPRPASCSASGCVHVAGHAQVPSAARRPAQSDAALPAADMITVLASGAPRRNPAAKESPR